MLNSVNYAQVMSEVHGMCDRFIVSLTVIIEMLMTVYYAIFVKYINNN